MLHRCLAHLLVSAALACALSAPSGAQAGSGSGSGATRAGASAGTIEEWSELRGVGRLPTRVSASYRFTYVSLDQLGRPSTSSGVLWLPERPAPAGGYRLLSFAHGTTGLDDACAPSISGFVNPEFNVPNVQAWLNRGYAVVASDYAGLGTPGFHAYLGADGLARNVVDAVRAAHRLDPELPEDRHLSSQWALLGQSEGGFAVVQAAAIASAREGRGLDFRGTVATGAPAHVEQMIGSSFTPASRNLTSPPALAYSAYILASLRAFTRLRIEAVLTPAGRRAAGMAPHWCVGGLTSYFARHPTNLGAWFSRPVASLKRWPKLSRAYMGMPSGPLDRPIFLANGFYDQAAPVGNSAAYAQELKLRGSEVTWKTYKSDHRHTMRRYLHDAFRFVRRLWR